MFTVLAEELDDTARMGDPVCARRGVRASARCGFAKGAPRTPDRLNRRQDRLTPRRGAWHAGAPEVASLMADCDMDCQFEYKFRLGACMPSFPGGDA